MNNQKKATEKDLEQAPLPQFDKPKQILEESIEFKKKKILDNYILDDISFFQYLEFNLKKKKEKIILYPKMQIEINDTLYYMFFNDDLIKLKKIFFGKLEDLINEHYIVLNYDKSALYEKANSSSNKFKLKLPIQVWRMIGNLVGPQSYLFAPVNIIRKVASLTDSTILKLAKIYSTTCANLNYAINQYGNEIVNGKICYILIKKDFDDFISVEESEELSIIEKTISTIYNSSISEEQIIKSLKLF